MDNKITACQNELKGSYQPGENHEFETQVDRSRTYYREHLVFRM